MRFRWGSVEIERYWVLFVETNKMTLDEKNVFLCTFEAKLGQENLPRMMKWMRWHCPLDTGFEFYLLRHYTAWIIDHVIILASFADALQP